MVVGILQVELSIPGSESLKDKRRVVRSLKDKLHREHQVSVAETAAHDVHGTAVIGIAVAAAEGRRAGDVLDSISNKLRKLLDAEVIATSRAIISGEEPESADDTESVEQSSETMPLNAGATG